MRLGFRVQGCCFCCVLARGFVVYRERVRVLSDRFRSVHSRVCKLHDSEAVNKLCPLRHLTSCAPSKVATQSSEPKTIATTKTP